MEIEPYLDLDLKSEQWIGKKKKRNLKYYTQREEKKTRLNLASSLRLISLVFVSYR